MLALKMPRTTIRILSLKNLSEMAKSSSDSIGNRLVMTHERSKSLDDDIAEKQKLLDKALTTLDSTL